MADSGSEGIWRKLADREERYHNLMLSSGAIVETNETFADLPVFKIVEGGKYNNGPPNEPDYKYFYDYHYIKASTADQKLGICLHFTAGQLQPDLQCLTIPRSGTVQVSTPFLVGRNGKIYQLHHPDFYGWHLGSNFGWSRNRNNLSIHPRMIGIEISNYGTLYRVGEKKLNCNHGFYCTTEDRQAYHNIEEMGFDVPFRHFGTRADNGLYFASYTDEQYEAISRLVRALCKKYPFDEATNRGIKPELLPEEIRYEYFGPSDDGGNILSPKISEAGWSSERFINWNGISSHVNWKGKAGGKWQKWDIGPAFEWDRVLPNDRVNFPTQPNDWHDIESPIRYFSNSERSLLGSSSEPDSEKEFKGGLYPATGNSMLHGGVHLSCRSNSFTEIKACAPGYIVAARMTGYDVVKPDDEVDEKVFKNFIRNKDLSFVLIKHDCNIWDNSENEMKLKDETSFYSLYMHLVEPDWELIEGNRENLHFYSVENRYKNVNWIREILMGRQLVYSLDRSGEATIEEGEASSPLGFGSSFLAVSSDPIEAGPGRVEVYGESGIQTINKQNIYAKAPPELKKAYDGLKAGKVVTFSDAYIPVKGGEVIGYVETTPDVKYDGDFLHFEIFSDAGTDGAIKKLLAEDDEFKALFKDLSDQNDDNLVSKNDASTLNNSLTSTEQGLPNVSNFGSVAFPAGNKTKAQSDMVDFRDAVKSLFDTGLCDIENADNTRSQVELKDYYLVELKIDDAPNIKPATNSENDKVRVNLLDGGVIIEKSSGRAKNSFSFAQLQSGVEVYMPAKANRMRLSCNSSNIECLIEPGQDREWFKEFIVNRLRHIILEHKSEWSEQGIQGLIDKLVGRGIDLEFMADHAKTLSWWGKTGEFGEEKIYSDNSIFGSILPADGAVCNIHPITFLWYLSLLKREFKFSFKERYELEQPNKPEYWGFVTDSGYLFGKEAAIFVIGEKFQGGKEFSLKLHREDGGDNSLSSIDIHQKAKFSKEGVDTLSVGVNFFGKWKLKADNGDCQGITPVRNLIEIEKPQSYVSLKLIEQPESPLEIAIERVIKEGVDDSVAKVHPGEQAHLLFTFNKTAGKYPNYIEGLVFIRYQKHKKSEEPSADSWTDYDYAVPIVAGELKEELAEQPEIVQYRAVFYPDYMVGDVMVKETLETTDDIISFQLAFASPNGGISSVISGKECLGNGYKLTKSSIKELVYELDYIDASWKLEKHDFGEMQFTMAHNSGNAGLLIVKIPLFGNVIGATPRLTMNGAEVALKKADAAMLEAQVFLYGNVDGNELKFKAEVTDKEAFEGAEFILPVEGSYSTNIALDESKLETLVSEIEEKPEEVLVELCGQGVAQCVPTIYIFSLYYKLNSSDSDWQPVPFSRVTFYMEQNGEYKPTSQYNGIFFDRHGNLKAFVNVPKEWFLSSGDDEPRSVQFKIKRVNGSGKIYGITIGDVHFEDVILPAELAEVSDSEQVEEE